MFNRRQFLQRSAILSLAPTVPAFMRSGFASLPPDQEKILVVIQLSGGNDGLNTIVPYKEDGYLAGRKELRLPTDALVRIDDQTAFHPAMRSMADLLEDGRLAIVQGVGYPDPNRSHDVSMAVWHTGAADPEQHEGHGWLGRLSDRLPRSDGQASSVLVDSASIPTALRGRKSVAAAIDSLQDFQLHHDRVPGQPLHPENSLAQFMRRSAVQAYATADRIQAIAARSSGHANSNLAKLRSPLARHLKLIADFIRADFGPRVYYGLQPGYDTHRDQLTDHARLLETLSVSLQAFLEDLAESGNADRVLVLCFSEFGRQVKENASQGTDHGTAGPVLLAGKSIQGGLYGTAPDLNRLEANAPRFTVDFRRVYASLLQDWFQVNPQGVLGQDVDTRPLPDLVASKK